MTDVALMNATLAGRYTIDRELGAGGMAVVYLAEDIKHHRRVALKVLRPELAAVIGADRFLREIETTAKLQHPHILPLHDSGTLEGTAFYVMPFVEGESLRDRLTRETQLPVDDAIRIASEVASALDYAHRHGVVHRDIKPENIMLHDGQALVADFGIALAVSSAAGGSRMTETGMSLGTPHYMSPEQAMGDREITPRSDVYALGCVLYEMLLGEPPFTGPSAQAVIARVVTENPRSLTQQRRTIPAHVEVAVHKALEKLPADRFPTAAAFSAALANPGFTNASGPALIATRGVAGAPARYSRAIVAIALVAMAVAGAMAARYARRPDEAPVIRTEIVTPDTVHGLVWQPDLGGAPAASPDAQAIAFSLERGDTSVLQVKYGDRFDLWSVPGGGRFPVFSPDGQWLAYQRGFAIWKVRVGGGDPVRVGRLEESEWQLFGLVWMGDGKIFAAGSRGIWMLPASGGDATLLRPRANTELTVAISSAPDGRLLLNARPGGSFLLALLTPDGKDLRALPKDIEPPGWFVDDILVFNRGGQRTASRIDLAKLTLRGEAIPVSGLPSWRVSRGPTAAWVSGTSFRLMEPVWVSRSGVATPTGLPAELYRHPRLSPDGRRLAVSSPSMSVYDIVTGSRLRLTGNDATEPAWTHDGRRILTSAATGAGAASGLVIRASDGSEKPDTILPVASEENWPTDVASGDSLAAYYGGRGSDAGDVFVINLRTKSVQRIEEPGFQRGARFSPGNRWLAYQSTESGRSEIVVQPWPALNAKHIVSFDGGEEPSWSRDGRELFFRQGDRMMMVRVQPGAVFQASAPVEIFRVPYVRDMYGDQSYDVAADGRFLMLRRVGDAPVRVRVIYNFATELRRAIDEANRK